MIAAAVGPEYFNLVQDIMASWFGRLVLFGFTWALFYHLLNGIRHLFWDAGYGFELDAAYRSGWMVVFGSVLLTLIAWAVGYSS